VLPARDEFALNALAAAARRFRSASPQLVKRTRATSAAEGACVPRPDAGDAAQAESVKAVSATSAPAGKRNAGACRPSQERADKDFAVVFMALGRSDHTRGSANVRQIRHCYFAAAPKSFLESRRVTGRRHAPPKAAARLA
jgi:hypothetical protein